MRPVHAVLIQRVIDPEFHKRLSSIYQSYYDLQRHALRMTDDLIEAVRMGE